MLRKFIFIYLKELIINGLINVARLIDIFCVSLGLLEILTLLRKNIEKSFYDK